MIRVEVEPGNPGQFFAACGIFEVAARLWPAATGRFVDGAFEIAADGSLAELLARVRGMEIRAERMALESKSNQEAEKPGKPKAPTKLQPARDSPLVVDPAGLGLRVDWWLYDAVCKTWSGRMSIVPIMLEAQRLLGSIPVPSALLDFATEPRTRLTYLDARCARGAGPVDRGYSPDNVKEKTVAYPAVELFGTVGLQRFRALRGRDDTHTYTTWAIPLPLLVAPVGATQGQDMGGSAFCFRPAGRGGDYARALRPA